MSKSNTEKLLSRMKAVGGMTRKQMATYMLKLGGNGDTYGLYASDRGLYSATFYGTSSRTGILENFCKKQKGKWVVTKKVAAPFTTAR